MTEIYDSMKYDIKDAHNEGYHCIIDFRNRFDKNHIYYNDIVLRRPMTPSEWVTKEPVMIPVTRVSLRDCYGDVGRTIYLKRLPLKDLIDSDRLIVYDWEDHKTMVNMDYVMTADNYHSIATVIIDSKNPNYPLGEYRYSFVICDGVKVRLE